MDSLVSRIDQFKAEVPVEQLTDELAQFIYLLRAEEVGSVLEIGSRYGGTLRCWLDLLPVRHAVTVDSPLEGPGVITRRELTWRAWLRPEQDLRCVWGRSESSLPAAQAALADLGLSKVDMVFIDGGHRYDDVMTDWRLYGPLATQVIAFHDISPSRRLSAADYGVPAAWADIKAGYAHSREIVSPREVIDGYGIGVVYPE